MIKDKEIAKRLSESLLEAAGFLNEAAALIARSELKGRERQKFLLAVGQAMGAVGTKILNPLFQEHPELKPAEYRLPEEY